MQLYTNDEVKKFLPHRDPFLFIDSIESIEIFNQDLIKVKRGEVFTKEQIINSVVKANYFVSENMKVLEGHFPGNPILPGVVQIEMIAQAAAFTMTLVEKNPLINQISAALIMVDSAKFRKPIKPNMNLVIESKCLKIRGNHITHSGLIYHNGDLCAQAQIWSIAEYPKSN
jgi:3-hydroxyacyl-[acyl-carrier-protein] dehydratase